MAENNLDRTVSEYEGLRPQYERMAHEVRRILKHLLDSEGVAYQDVQARAKEVKSFGRKIEEKSYDDPLRDIHDLAGVRVIVYLERDRPRVADLIAREFHVHPEKSVDKDSELGIDRFGYRALHYVCDLGERCKLTELREYADLVCEIQVTTILCHAWSEVEHDPNYRLGGELPDELQRRFALLAAVLELADRELNAVAEEAGEYSAGVASEMRQGELGIPITTPALEEYGKQYFPRRVEAGLQPRFWSRQREKWAFEFLRHFGITHLVDLHAAFPSAIDGDMAAVIPGGDLYSIVVDGLLLRDAPTFMCDVFRQVTEADAVLRLLPDHMTLLEAHGAELADLVDQGLIVVLPSRP